MKQELVTLEDFDFLLVLSRVKNINIRILHNGAVRVSAPYNADKAEIIRFVEGKRQWILKHKDKHYLNDGEYFYLGKRRKIADLKGCSLADFYSKEARQVLKTRYDRLAERLTDNPPHLIIKPLKGKYGYYTKSAHEICLNARLIMVPVECIDYVIAHELMHIKHFNHGRDFHAALREIIPCERELRDAISKYILW